MSAKYGITLVLSGPKDAETKCFTELAASLQKDFTDRYDGQVSYTLPAITGSYWAKVRKSDGTLEVEDIIVRYMLTTPGFWSNLHYQSLERLAALWPSLTLYIYGDSFDAGDGFQGFYANGKMIVEEVFHLNTEDRPSAVKRWYGDGVTVDNLYQHIPEKFADAFRESDADVLPQEWEEVRAEIATKSNASETDTGVVIENEDDPIYTCNDCDPHRT